MDKAPDAFRTISEVADDLDVPQHVLRFWESRFAQIRPMKRGGGRRYYRPDDVDLLRGIRHLLYGEGYTIRGVQRILREQGGRFVQSVWRDGAPQPERGAPHASDDGDPGLPDDLTAAEIEDGGEADEGEAGHAAAAGSDRPRAAPAIRVRPAPPVPAIPAEDLRKLQATLDGLIECRRLLDAALGPA